MAAWIKRVHNSSAFAVYVSIVLLIEALWEAARGVSALHAALMSSIVLPVFVTGIATSYAASGARRSARAETVALLLVAATYTVALLGVVAGFLVLLERLPPRLLLGLVYGVYAIILWVVVGIGSLAGSVALSIAGLAYAYTLASTYSILTGQTIGFYEYYLGLVYALAVTSIYAVTVHSFPSTYGGKPRAWLVYLLYAAQGAGVATYAWRPYLGSLVLALAMLLYIPAARLDKLPLFLEKARSMKPGPARSSHLYFLVGHVFAVIYVALVLGASLMYSSFPSTYKLLYIFIHTTTMGFVLQHILIHAPMMVPIILGIPTARRYTALNYIASFLATISFPISEEAALVLLVISLVLTVLIVWPRRWPPRIPLSV